MKCWLRNIAAVVAGSHKPVFAWAIVGLFLAGGVAAAFMIPAPAYLPMAWLGILVGRRLGGGRSTATQAG